MAIRIRPKRILIRKSEESQRVLDALDEYLEGNIEEPMQWLVRFWKDQAAVLTYKELRSIVTDEEEPKKLFTQWFQDYARLMEGRMTDTWKDAFINGWKQQEAFREMPDVVGSETNVREWITNRTGELITNCTEEQKEAIKYVIAEARAKGMSSAETARYIRPTIGLTRPQEEANLKLYNSVKEKLREEHPRMTEESIERKARDAAAKYAGKQQRTRAETIARTEVAQAYNEGNDAYIREGIAQGLLPEMIKEWSTAKVNVCPACIALEGKQIGMDESFQTKSGRRDIIEKLPPLHPRCKCAIKYVEVKPEDGIIKLPGYKNAVIPDAKFSQYAVNPEKSPEKAKAFKDALGYDMTNYQDLIQNIRDNLPKYNAKENGSSEYGTRYEVVMILKGPNGKTAKVLTGWISDKSNGEMRLTTAHVDD